MQGTTAFEQPSAAPLFPQAEPVFAEAPALDTPVARLTPPSAPVQGLIGPLLGQGVLWTAGLLGRPAARHRRERARQDAARLEQPASGGPGRGRGGSHALMMAAAAVRVAPQEAQAEGMDEPDSGDSVVLLLAAITLFLGRRVLGADNGLCRQFDSKGHAEAGAPVAVGHEAARASHGAAAVRPACPASPARCRCWS